MVQTPNRRHHPHDTPGRPGGLDHHQDRSRCIPIAFGTGWSPSRDVDSITIGTGPGAFRSRPGPDGPHLVMSTASTAAPIASPATSPGDRKPMVPSLHHHHWGMPDNVDDAFAPRRCRSALGTMVGRWRLVTRCACQRRTAAAAMMMALEGVEGRWFRDVSTRLFYLSGVAWDTTRGLRGRGKVGEGGEDITRPEIGRIRSCMRVLIQPPCEAASHSVPTFPVPPLLT
ncbi:hypothetical protein QBC39DRAFT_49314 [Podospora conica]|nr:hypothetical protein QBC39DRAFT_49314 [Schizothecium conicum]